MPTSPGLRYCLSGGAPMPVPLIERYAEEKGVVFRQGFGMTEFGPDVFSLSSEDSVRKAGSDRQAQLLRGRQGGRSRHRADRASRRGRASCCCGDPSATTGYFGDPEATAAAFDDDGYFHTGDLARIDDDGLLLHRRSAQGHVRQRGRERVPRRGRSGPPRLPRCRHVCRRRRSRRASGARSVQPSWSPPPMPTSTQRTSKPTCGTALPSSRCPARCQSSTSCRYRVRGRS